MSNLRIMLATLLVLWMILAVLSCRHRMRPRNRE